MNANEIKKTMKAVLIEEFGGLDKLKLTDVPRPHPSEGEVLIRIKAAGVNPVDWKVRIGRLEGRLHHKFPLILGWDLAGVIEETGYSVKRFKKGDEVYAYCRRPVVQHGTYAEYAAVPESYVSPRPRSLSFEESSSIPLAALTAYQAIYDAAKLKNGESVLIVGASGGVGGFAVQFAKMVGATVIGVASEQNHSYLKELGADWTIDYVNTDFVDTFKNQFSDGADVVFNLVKGDTILKARECAKKGGRLVSIGDDPASRFPDEKEIKLHYVFAEPNVIQLDHIRELVESGKLKTFVCAQYTLSEVKKAHEQMETGHTRGKIVLKV